MEGAMRLYRVHMNGDFGDCDSFAIWVGSKREIPAARRQVFEASHDPNHTPMIDELDVPKTKTDLLAFLNLYCDR